MFIILGSLHGLEGHIIVLRCVIATMALVVDEQIMPRSNIMIRRAASSKSFYIFTIAVYRSRHGRPRLAPKRSSAFCRMVGPGWL